MLVRFRAGNFRSLRDEQELSLVASSLKEESGAVVNVEHVPNGLLPVAAVYGANASGKSNVLEAMRFACDAIRNSQTRWQSHERIPRRPFLLDESARERPSRFVFDAVIDGVLYEYGFSLNSEAFLTEWLHAYPKGRRQVWFSRDARKPEPFSFGKNLTGENRTIEKFTRSNSLFLSAAAQNNHYLLSSVFGWLVGEISFFDMPVSVFSEEEIAEFFSDSRFTLEILRLLRVADFGISRVEVRRRTLLTIDPKLSMSILHSGKDGKSLPIGFDDESRGTTNFLSLLGPILSALDTGSVLIIDELEASIHPELARRIVRLFNSRESNPKGAQLVFSTHSTNLLGGGLLRRDQIWFTEKDGEGATHLYPLSDFRPRGTENVERGYLQGRYGAIPFLGDFDRLLEQGIGNEDETAPE